MISGLQQILWGAFKKAVIADTLAIYVNAVYNNVHSYSGLPLVVATIFFAFQIYCDFSGYSDIAIGTARVLGFTLMENFRQPYFSGSVREFWTRWHISLSTWFRDYVYIPLGGNRVSLFRHLVNLMVVFAVSGLWLLHGRCSSEQYGDFLVARLAAGAHLGHYEIVSYIVRIAKLLAVWIVMFIILCAYVTSIGITYLTPYASDVFKQSVIFGGMLYTIMQWSSVLASPAVGFPADRFTTSKTILALLLLMAMSLFLFVFVQGGPHD